VIDEQFVNNIPLEEIKELYEALDEKYNIYDVLRSFSNIVKLIEEKLINDNDRKSYYKKLINLTDYAHIRLICAAIQFEDSPNAQYLKENEEFSQLIEEVGLSFELYKY